MSYYLEARKHEKNLRMLSKDMQKRSERRKEVLAQKLGDPFQQILLVGTASRIIRDNHGYATIHSEQALVPWSGRTDTMIDRFDARSMMDMIPPGPQPNEITEEEKLMEGLVNYERYRGIIEANRIGVDEEEHLEMVEFQIKNKILKGYGLKDAEVKDSASMVSGKQKKEEPKKKEIPKAADYSRIGYNYGSSGNASNSNSNEILQVAEVDSESSDSDVAVIKDEQVDDIAQEWGIGRTHGSLNYSKLLRYERRQRDWEREVREQEELIQEARQKQKGGRRRRRRRNRKRRAAIKRDSDLSGEDTRHLKEDSGVRTRARSHSSSRSISSSRSRSNHSTKIQYITSFSVAEETRAEDSENAKAANDKRLELSFRELLSGFFPVLAPDRSSNRPMEDIAVVSVRRASEKSYLVEPQPNPKSSPSGSHSRSRSRSKLRSRSRSKLRSRSRSRSNRSSRKNRHYSRHKRSPSPSQSPIASMSTSKEQKNFQKLTPAERLKLKMRKAFDKQIKQDHDEELVKIKAIEREREERRKEMRKIKQLEERRLNSNSRSRSRSRSRRRSSRSRSHSRQKSRNYRRSSSDSRDRSRSRRKSSRSRSHSRQKPRNYRRSSSDSRDRSRSRRKSSRSRSRSRQKSRYYRRSSSYSRDRSSRRRSR